MFFITCSAKAVEDNLNIEFSEFCPYKSMQNIDTSKHYILSSKQYWSERKQKFQDLKAFCLGMDTDEKKSVCIERLRSFETDLTNKHFEEETKQSEDSFAPVLVLPFMR